LGTYYSLYNLEREFRSGGEYFSLFIFFLTAAYITIVFLFKLEYDDDDDIAISLFSLFSSSSSYWHFLPTAHALYKDNICYAVKVLIFQYFLS